MLNGRLNTVKVAHCVLEPYSEKLKCSHHFFTDKYIPMTKTVIIIDIKIIHKRTFGLSIQNNGPATVKLTIFQLFSITLAINQFYSCRSITLY